MLASFDLSARKAIPPASAPIPIAIIAAGFALITAFNAAITPPASEDTLLSFIITDTTVVTGPLTVLKVLKAATSETATGAILSILLASLMNIFPSPFTIGSAIFTILFNPASNVLFKASIPFLAGSCIFFGKSLMSPVLNTFTISVADFLSWLLLFTIPFANALIKDTDALTIFGADCATLTDKSASTAPASSTAASNPPFCKAFDILPTALIPSSAASFNESSIFS